MTASVKIKKLTNTKKRSFFQANNFGVNNDAGMTFENYLFKFAEKYSYEYEGGFWEMGTITDLIAYEDDHIFGAVAPFMWPTRTDGKKWAVKSPTNFYEGKMSSEAFGLALSILSLWHVALNTLDKKINERYETLKELSYSHAESAEIIGFLD